MEEYNNNAEDIYDFLNDNIPELNNILSLNYTEELIRELKKNGKIYSELYKLKCKRAYIEYLKIKIQNMLSNVDPFLDYDPIKEAENILKRF